MEGQASGGVPVSGLTGWPGPGQDILSPHEDGRILRHQERGQVEVQRHQDGAESIRKCWSVLKLLLHVTESNISFIQMRIL